MAGVVLENVSRVYPGGVSAVRGIDLEVHDHEFIVLVGPSGCGKTTTLRLIAGLEELSGGKITIGSHVVNDVRPKDRDIAMVFQNYALYPHMNVYRNMAFGLELREGTGTLGWLWGWALPKGRKAQLAARRFSIAQRVREAARMLGIEDLLERFPRQLSGGERQRVALGRAIVRSPAAFLFDEPLSNLDAKLRVEMRRELKQLHRRLQTTMIYVTHDQVEALTLGERIVVMNDGQIQQIGPPMEVYDWPTNRFVAGFIGTPAMNFVEGWLVKEGAEFGFRRGKWFIPLAARVIRPDRVASGQAVVLGVRPEHVRIEREGGEGARISGVVQLVELLGDSTIATLEVDGVNETSGDLEAHHSEAFYVLIRMESRADLRPGERVRVAVDPARWHLFDRQTGQSLVRKPDHD